MLFGKRKKKDEEMAAAIVDTGSGRQLEDDEDELIAAIAAAVAAVMGSETGAGRRYRIRSFRPSEEWATAGRYESMRPHGAV